MEITIIYNFLSAFFSLFQAHVNNFKIEGGIAVGDVEWSGESDRQSFSWKVQHNESSLFNTQLLCQYLVKGSLLNGDKILISRIELQNKLSELGWNPGEAEKNIEYLTSVRVQMVDKGEETDFFLVHF